MKRETQGGYIGVLIGCLMTAVLLSFLFVRYMNISAERYEEDESMQPLTASGTVPTSKLESYQADIDAAHGIQNVVDTNTKKVMPSLETE